MLTACSTGQGFTVIDELRKKCICSNLGAKISSFNFSILDYSDDLILITILINEVALKRIKIKFYAKKSLFYTKLFCI